MSDGIASRHVAGAGGPWLVFGYSPRMHLDWSDLRGAVAAGCLLISSVPAAAQVAAPATASPTQQGAPQPAAPPPSVAAVSAPTDRFAIPATDDGLPGTGPIRRMEWFQNLWKQRRSQWATQVQRDQGAVVFLGDSITQGWGLGLGAVFPGVKVANRGISGDTTRGVLIRLKEDVLDLNPRAVVILIGTNDLEEKATPETIDSDFRLLIAALEAHDPKMPIIACLVMPSSVSMRRPAEEIKKINALRMASIEGHAQVIPLDTWTLFADATGEPKKDEFPDVLHPNDYGYIKFAAALRPIFATLGFTETEPDYFTPEPGFESLFNGTDLTGWGLRPTTAADKESARRWQASDPNAAAWPVVDQTMPFDGRTSSPDGRFQAIHGRLVVTTPPEARRIQQIWTKREFPKDFVLKLEFRATPNADSGVYLRGPQLQCRDYALAGPFTNLTKYKPQDWNEMIVTVANGLATATVNGEKLDVETKVPPTGPIGLEGDRGQMEYRRIRIKTAN
jgi:lysophospholipase L1-like esterase